MYVYSTLPWQDGCEGPPHNTLMTIIALILKKTPSNTKGHVSVFLEIHIFILDRFRIKLGKSSLFVFCWFFFLSITHSSEHKGEQGKTKEKQTII